MACLSPLPNSIGTVSSSASTRRDRGSKRSPKSVRRMPLVWRSNNCTLSRSSSSAIDRVTTDCARNKATEALDTLPCSATLMKARTCIRLGSSVDSMGNMLCELALQRDYAFGPLEWQ
ncbi:hypothetical protein D3C87_1165740 [compost metagenome]